MRLVRVIRGVLKGLFSYEGRVQNLWQNIVRENCSP